ncbi:MAG: histidinol dehydrogenase [Ahniella sp.]|nr:histidinol dehydrogenase [Ahniella sp.]
MWPPRHRQQPRFSVDSIEDALVISNPLRARAFHSVRARSARVFVGVRHAGTVFLGDYAPESVGDCCSGTNHVLPTAGGARAYSGVSGAEVSRPRSLVVSS